MKRIHYLSIDEILFIHSAVIQKYGGSHGVRDLPLLLAAAARPKQQFGGNDLYPDLFLKAAALFHSLIFNHAFLDGNKRTAISATAIFLKKNGRTLQVKRNLLFRFVIRVVKQKPAVAKIAEWLQRATR